MARALEIFWAPFSRRHSRRASALSLLHPRHLDLPSLSLHIIAASIAAMARTMELHDLEVIAAIRVDDGMR